MKKTILFFLATFITLVAFAQLEVKDGSFKEVPGFVNINPNPDYQYDDNDKPFAVLKVITENINEEQRSRLLFQGDAQTYIMVEYKVGEVWLYISYYASYIKISHPDFSSTEFSFPFDMEPKCGYELTIINKGIDEDIVKRIEKLENATSNTFVIQSTEQVGYITIKSTPKGADVFIDNVKVGVTPYLSESLSVGNHKISVNLAGYEPEAKRVNIEPESEIELVFTLNVETVQNPVNNHKLKKENQTFTVNGFSFDMIYVEGDNYSFGCELNRYLPDGSDYITQDVTIKDFYIAKFEVTQQFWQAVMGYEPTCNDGWTYDVGKGNNYPAYRINWFDCLDFIRRLNQLTGKNFRLPTEAEWEYAAKGGKKSKDYKFSGSLVIDNVAWHYYNCNGMVHPVGGKAPNELGIYDMTGNVSEMCFDYCDCFYNEEDQMVVRGGSIFSDLEKYLFVTYRKKAIGKTECYFDMGFRIALDFEE